MRLGILGAGQLGRMLSMAALGLGLTPVLYEIADLGNLDLLTRFSQGLDVCTFEFENIPLDTAALVAQHCPLRPGLRALEIAQDRLIEKEFLRSLGIPTADFRAVDAPQPMQGILKTRRLGYDGKGQTAAHPGAWEQLGSVPCILEQKVDFQRELSIVAVRSLNGETAFYPVVETLQSQGILTEVIAPARQLSPALQQQARHMAQLLLEGLDYVGVLALELFEFNDGLLANEIAPRVHNSGHWTDRGAYTSQFENHLRAILGWPLGDTGILGACRMRNWVGWHPDMASLPRPAGFYPQLYGKEVRPGRKVGHLTLVAPSQNEVDQMYEQLS